MSGLELVAVCSKDFKAKFSQKKVKISFTLQISIVFSNCVGFQNRPVDKKPCRDLSWLLSALRISNRFLQFYTSIVVGYKGLELVVVGFQDFKEFCCRLQGI